MPIAIQVPTGSVTEGFEPLDGNNFSRVADDSDATFVSESSPATDRLSFPDLPADASSVTSVAFLWRAVSLSGDHTARVKLWLGASTTAATTRALATSIGSFLESALARPGGGSWSVADVNALDAGYELLGGSALSDARVHRLVRLVDYVSTVAAPVRAPQDLFMADTAERQLDAGNTASLDLPDNLRVELEVPPSSALDIGTGGQTSPPLEVDDEDGGP